MENGGERTERCISKRVAPRLNGVLCGSRWIIRARLSQTRGRRRGIPWCDIPAKKHARIWLFRSAAMIFVFQVTIGFSAEPVKLPAKEKNTALSYESGKERMRDSGDEYFRIERFPVPAEAELI